MAVETQKLPNEPILIITAKGKFTPENIETSFNEINKYYDPDGEMLYIISDNTELDMSFSDVVTGLASVTRREGFRFGAPNSMLIMVGTSEMVRLGTEAMKQKQYGNLEVPMFDNIDDAIAFARNHHKENASS
ncbi:MAG: hypothetical protein CUN55_14910 [Phototrophicales bacterium]|nr:MAG: hypothetical protein CUN55_14910 [Phototrophicales bacterium]